MGLLISRILAQFRKESKILMLGLDAAGKTTTLYNLKVGEVVTTIPTIGFNVEAIQYKNVDFTCWDVGGQKKLRNLWHHYYVGTDALIYVVDSVDQDRFAEAREQLHSILEDEAMRNAAVLVFANKQDLPGAANASDLAKHMGLHSLRGREWYIQPCCATTADGLYEGLDWVCTQLNERGQK